VIYFIAGIEMATSGIQDGNEAGSGKMQFFESGIWDTNLAG
jgi:hypothetical protein